MENTIKLGGAATTRFFKYLYSPSTTRKTTLHLWRPSQKTKPKVGKLIYSYEDALRRVSVFIKVIAKHLPITQFISRDLIAA